MEQDEECEAAIPPKPPVHPVPDQAGRTGASGTTAPLPAPEAAVPDTPAPGRNRTADSRPQAPHAVYRHSPGAPPAAGGGQKQPANGHGVPPAGHHPSSAYPPGQVRGEHTHGRQLVPRPVHRHSVRGQILAALRDALVRGELVTGEVYSAPALGERFGVSATPVREAMQQLAAEGAVEAIPNRGFRVCERDHGEITELAEVRDLIEVPVILRLARIVPAERWAELRPLADATREVASQGDRAAYAECDRAFHRAVLSLSGNRQLVIVADDLHRRSQWPPVSALAARRADLVADAAQHSALLDALTAKDLPVLRSLVRGHFTGGTAD